MTMSGLAESHVDTNGFQSPPGSPRPPNSPRSHHSRSRHDSKVSVASRQSVQSTRSRKEYIDSLPVPNPAQMEEIGKVQEKKETDVILKRAHLDEIGDANGCMSEEERRRAAVAIQRSYRGHRERRMLEGLSLDPSTRWIEAVKEARYRHLTDPRALDDGGLPGQDGERSKSAARLKWKKIGIIARRAGGDEDSDSSGSDSDATEDEKEARRKKRLEEKLKRREKAKVCSETCISCHNLIRRYLWTFYRYTIHTTLKQMCFRFFS